MAADPKTLLTLLYTGNTTSLLKTPVAFPPFTSTQPFLADMDGTMRMSLLAYPTSKMTDAPPLNQISWSGGALLM